VGVVRECMHVGMGVGVGVGVVHEYMHVGVGVGVGVGERVSA